MEAIKDLGTDIMELIEPTTRAFAPLLRAHEAEILSVKRKTFKFGATDRHQLDVYFPSDTKITSAPTLFFVYGGGYVSGSRVIEGDLKYKNTGAFFAKRGFVTVIADYRLFPGIKYPDPSIDIKDAFAWVVANIDQVNQDVEVEADVTQVFFMGHSAGAAIVATMVLAPELLSASLRERIKGLVLNAGTYDFRKTPSLNPLFIREFYGPEEEVREKEPLGLLENAPSDILQSFPPILAIIAEHDFPPIVVSCQDFIQVVNEKVSSPVQELVMKGHNHVSPYNSLYSGEGEDWGLEVVQWLKSKAN